MTTVLLDMEEDYIVLHFLTQKMYQHTKDECRFHAYCVNVLEIAFCGL